MNAARKIKTVQVDKNDFVTYSKRARQYLESARSEINSGRWESVALLCIHCAISAGDAVLVFERGERSMSDNHYDAVHLIKSMSIKDADKKSVQMWKIISQKNRAEYEQRPITERDAVQLLVLVERFHGWIDEYLRPAYEGKRDE